MKNVTRSAIHRTPMLLLVLAYAAFISLGLPDTLLGVAWPSISQQFAVPLGWLGILLAAASAGYLTASVPGGWVAARLGIGRLLAASCLLAAASLVGYALAPLWGLLLLASYFLGMGGGAIDTGLNTYAAEHFSPRHINWLHACYGLGAMIGPLIVTAVLGAGLVWQWAYLITAGLLTGMAAAFWLTRRRWEQPPPAVPAAAPAEPMPLRRVHPAELVRLPVAWGSVLLFYIYTGLEVTAGSWSYTLLTEGRGAPAAQAGLWISIYWGSLTFGRLVFGILSERFAARVLLRLCIPSLLLSTLLVWQGGAGIASYAGLALTGFLLAPVFPLMIAQTPARIGRRLAPHLIGLQVAAANIGSATLPALTGWLVDRVGLESVGAMLIALAVLLLLLHEAIVMLATPRSTVQVPPA